MKRAIDTKVNQTIVDDAARLLRKIDRSKPQEIAHHLGMWWTEKDLQELVHMEEEKVLIRNLTALIKARLALLSKRKRSEVARALQGYLRTDAGYWELEALASGEAHDITEALIEQFNI